MLWQNVINACLAIIMTLLVYQNTVLQDQIAILETDIRIIKHTLEIPKERVQFEVIDTLPDDEIIEVSEENICNGKLSQRSEKQIQLLNRAPLGRGLKVRSFRACGFNILIPRHKIIRKNCINITYHE